MPDPIKYRPTLNPSTVNALNEEGKRAQSDMPSYLKELVGNIKDPGARAVFENRLNTITSYLPYEGQQEDINQFLRVITDYSGVAGSPSVNRFRGFTLPSEGRPSLASFGLVEQDVQDLKNAGMWEDVQSYLDKNRVMRLGKPNVWYDLTKGTVLQLALPEDYDKDGEGRDIINKDQAYSPTLEWNNFISEMSHAVEKNMRYPNAPEPLRVAGTAVEAISDGVRTALEGEVPWRSGLQYRRHGAMENRTHYMVEPYYRTSVDSNKSVDPRYVMRATPWR